MAAILKIKMAAIPRAETNIKIMLPDYDNINVYINITSKAQQYMKLLHFSEFSMWRNGGHFENQDGHYRK